MKSKGAFSPTVSVVTPAYNASEYIESTIESVREQTYPDWEMIVVDDGSQDDTKSRVAGTAAKDDRIKLIECNKNEGPGPARNRAMIQAGGKYVAFLDADDLWHPEKLERQLDFMAQSGAYFSYTAYQMLSNQNHQIQSIVPARARTSYADLLKNTNIGCLTVMIDMQKVDDLRMPNIPVRQPLVLWLKLLRTYGPANGLNEILASYRVREGSISRNKRRAALGVWRVYREFENLSLPYAAWYFTNYAVRGFLRNR